MSRHGVSAVQDSCAVSDLEGRGGRRSDSVQTGVESRQINLPLSSFAKDDVRYSVAGGYAVKYA